MVSIRRADLGLLELNGDVVDDDCDMRFNPPGGFGAFGTKSSHVCPGVTSRVSIRRADLGLLEQHQSVTCLSPPAGFQSAGRIWGFWNCVWYCVPVADGASFNPPGGFGAFGTSGI
ncbi:hypothetical protein OSCT_0326 [Oscillochloris trichoides DG-6]|uniref:Uncharacterized protein n=1 Tax=Oscillochloris trichoides DG-6 TaxID=765420 RepID=E1IAH5_9CHLR|nr:hypothetical protein OSCT_0326 [Oscillochloris trichoides DG-6]